MTAGKARWKSPQELGVGAGMKSSGVKRKGERDSCSRITAYKRSHPAFVSARGVSRSRLPGRRTDRRGQQDKWTKGPDPELWGRGGG